jgi:hypothetical protein
MLTALTLSELIARLPNNATFEFRRSKWRAVAAQFSADLRTAALQFSAAPDVAAALIVGAHTEAQVLDQCELHAGDNPAGVLGRTEAAEPHRAERAHAYGGLMPAGGLGRVIAAAAPPMSVMNARRFIRLPRRR